MKESGSTLAKCNFEIGVVSDIFRVAAGEAEELADKLLYQMMKMYFGKYAIRQPLGVIAGISPFNAPMILSSKNIGICHSCWK